MIPDRVRPHVREAQLEAVFQRLVRQQLGGMIMKLAPTHVGMPDRLVVLPIGRMFLVELKTESGRLSEAQAHYHERLAAVGTTVVVLYGLTQITEWCRARAADYDPKPRRRRASKPKPTAEPVEVPALAG